MFTVKAGCDECISVQTELTGVQYSYKQAGLDTFFGVLYYEKHLETRDIYQLHDLKTVPYICTSKQELKRDPNEDFYKVSDKWFLKREDAHETQV
jgi:hypothetical protein